MTFQTDATFLREAATFFERRDWHGEDAAFWANTFNAQNCRRIADYVERLSDSDTRRMAETGTGSVRSTGSAGPQGIAPEVQP